MGDGEQDGRLDGRSTRRPTASRLALLTAWLPWPLSTGGPSRAPVDRSKSRLEWLEFTNCRIDEVAWAGRLSSVELPLTTPSLEPMRAEASEGGVEAGCGSSADRWRRQPRPGVDQREGQVARACGSRLGSFPQGRQGQRPAIRKTGRRRCGFNSSSRNYGHGRASFLPWTVQ